MAKKILIIDDDADYVEAVSATLQGRGYEVTARSDGPAGFSAAKSWKPDIIILDIMMAYDSEGLDMAGKLAQDAATNAIPIVLVTGIRHPEDLPANSAMIKATLEKPVKPDVLIAAIENALKKA